jgi:hypothetical protein
MSKSGKETARRWQQVELAVGFVGAQSIKSMKGFIRLQSKL